jgi:TonB family protein
MQPENLTRIRTLKHSSESDSGYLSLVCPIASRMVAALLICLWFVLPVWCNVDKDRKAAARSLATEIERAQFHKVYVTDFLDSAGARTEKGCFFASAFSTLLSEDTHSFAVVNRIQAQKQIDDLHISPQDIQKPEVLSKAALVLGVDVVLVGTATLSPKDATLLLSLREAASGKEVHSMDYHEQLKPTFENIFPAAEGESTHIYYFPGLDGVSQVRCIYCPDPSYSDEMRRNKIQGTVLMSVRIDEKGTITDVRVIKKPDKELAKEAVRILTKWRLEPSHDAEGNTVPVRTSIEIGFRLLN